MAARVARRARSGAAPLIERASPADRAFLAMDSGQVPEQFGVVLLLDDAAGLSPGQFRDLIAGRITAVPRLRQRLVRVPLGCGGPVWVDDARFEIRNHVRTVACPPPADEQALLDQALAIVLTRLPRSRPLWSATLVTGLAGGQAGLVIVLHHTLADGLGGLAVLASMIDGAEDADAAADAGPAFPRPGPDRASLVAEAWQNRLRGLGRIRQWWRLLRGSFGAAGGLAPPQAARCSLNRATGPRRRIVTVRVDHAELRASAHRFEATTNDAVLVAVAAAVRDVLRQRGENISSVALAVPVSGRPSDVDGPALGNMVSPMMVYVPATGDLAGRLADVASQVRAHKAAATGPPPIGMLGGLFRLLAAAGGYQAYMNHQHRLHTLVSHVRGPVEPVRFGGRLVTAAFPVVTGDSGNIPVFFEVLTYAGTLTVTMIADPEAMPETAELSSALRAALVEICDLAAAHR
ncbi:MAG TPA: wax ester/triacylglycerol synthase domain-containing protein [Streptosporangiaceae bacterium]